MDEARQAFSRHMALFEHLREFYKEATSSEPDGKHLGNLIDQMYPFAEGNGVTIHIKDEEKVIAIRIEGYLAEDAGHESH